jgi:hypothetical protein
VVAVLHASGQALASLQATNRLNLACEEPERAGYSQANAPLVALSLFSLSQGRLLPYWNIGPRGLIAVFSTLFHMHSQIM